MLIFSTKLIVNENLKEDVFINLAIEWVSGGNHYHFGKINWDHKDEFIVENDTQKFAILRSDNSVAVHLENLVGRISWTSDFALTVNQGKRVLATQLYSDPLDFSAKMPEKFNRPWLLKQIVSRGYGGTDHSLKIRDEFTAVTEENINIAKEILLNQREYFMPVVYVTPLARGAEYQLDCHELAKDLAGAAHVLAEESSSVTHLLKNATDEINPYNGAVQIIYPGGKTQRIIPEYNCDHIRFREEVAYAVFSKLILEKIEDIYSWQKIKYSRLVKESESNKEIADICDNLLAENQQQLDASMEQIDRLEMKINELTSKMQMQEYQLDAVTGNESVSSLKLFTKEADLYKGEINDIVVRTLKKELHQMETDVNLRESRKFHVLSDLVKETPVYGNGDEIKKQLKLILGTDGSMNGIKGRRLTELGFSIKEGRHYKLTFAGDDRYMLTLGKTPSDHRANLNAATKAGSKIFG